MCLKRVLLVPSRMKRGAVVMWRMSMTTMKWWRTEAMVSTTVMMAALHLMCLCAHLTTTDTLFTTTMATILSNPRCVWNFMYVNVLCYLL